MQTRSIVDEDQDAEKEDKIADIEERIRSGLMGVDEEHVKGSPETPKKTVDEENVTSSPETTEKTVFLL